MACVLRFLAVLAEPPAESPSTINISHSSGLRLSQLASLPLVSQENFCLVKRLVLAFSSCLRILAAFSAHAITDLSVSRFLSKNLTSSAAVMSATTLPASWLSSFVLVCPSKRGSGCFTATIAVIPFLTSLPVKLTSFSLSIPSSLAYLLITVVNWVLKPVRWVPPSAV